MSERSNTPVLDNVAFDIFKEKISDKTGWLVNTYCYEMLGDII